MNLTLTLRKIASSMLYYSGVVEVYSRFFRGGIILGYHHVLPKNDARIQFLQPGMYVTTETFEKHLAYLKEKFTIGSFSDIFRMNRFKSLCVITFDDGWEDNYTHAFPLLLKYGVPATIFLSTNMIGTTDWPWPDRISYYCTMSEGMRIPEILGILNDYRNEQNRYELKGKRNNVLEIDRIISEMKSLANDELKDCMGRIDRFLYSMRQELQTYPSWLTWKQVKEMQEGGVSFGAHTHNHTILTGLHFEAIRDEVVQGKRTLSKHLSFPLEVFSYPNGNHNDDCISILKEEGYSMAVTTRAGYVTGSANMMRLPRFLLHNDIADTVPMFVSRIFHMIPFA